MSQEQVFINTIQSPSTTHSMQSPTSLINETGYDMAEAILALSNKSFISESIQPLDQRQSIHSNTLRLKIPKANTSPDHMVYYPPSTSN